MIPPYGTIRGCEFLPGFREVEHRARTGMITSDGEPRSEVVTVWRKHAPEFRFACRCIAALEQFARLFAGGPVYSEFRADGWPLCPNCHEDELFSLALPTPTVDTIVGCYFCNWRPPSERWRSEVKERLDAAGKAASTWPPGEVREDRDHRQDDRDPAVGANREHAEQENAEGEAQKGDGGHG